MTKYVAVEYRNLLFIFVAIFMSLLLVKNGSAIEIDDGPIAQKILSRDTQLLFDQEKFDELEKMANEFRIARAQVIDGGWKLARFYNSFDLSETNKNDVQCEENINKLEKWMSKYPHSMTAKIATSNAWLTYAWKARGGGYANTVTEQGWNLMRERVRKAYQLLRDKPIKPSRDCPGRYYILIKIARAQGWSKEKYDALFHEAVSFDPGFHAYYMEKAFYITPRWGGYDGEWQQFAEEAVKLTPKSEGMGIYTRILRSMWVMKEFKDFNDPSVSWSKMKQGFLDMEKANPNSLYNLNSFCLFACIAGDKETAKALFKKIGKIPYTEAWGGRSNFNKWRRWAGVY
jgi:hypothetical protein